jgi:hypothetical protein
VGFCWAERPNGWAGLARSKNEERGMGRLVVGLMQRQNRKMGVGPKKAFRPKGIEEEIGLQKLVLNSDSGFWIQIKRF